jgi:hypothetical protein
VKLTTFSMLLALAAIADTHEPAKPTCPKCKKPLAYMGGGQWVCSLDPDKCREGE